MATPEGSHTGFVDPQKTGFTAVQLATLKRQIASLKALNIRLKTGANGVKTVLRLPSVIPKKRMTLSKRDQEENDDFIARNSDEEVPPAAPAASDLEPELEDAETSEDEQLSISSISGGDADNKSRPLSAPTRRTTRSVKRHSQGQLKESSIETSDIQLSDGSENREVESDREDKKETSRGKKRRKSNPSVVIVSTSDRPNVPLELKYLQPVKVTWHTTDDDALCSVCGDGDSPEDNVILLCEGPRCEVAVHQSCYGVTTVPKGKWLCDACIGKNKSEVSENRRCALCPVEGGALRRVTEIGNVKRAQPQTDRGGAKRKKRKYDTKNDRDIWAHVACALWTPEIRLTNPSAMSDVDISGLTKERIDLKCGVCRQSGGGVIQCSFGSCFKAFHVMCGRFAGYHLSFSIHGQALAFCSMHSKAQFTSVRKAMYSGKTADTTLSDQSDTDDEDVDAINPQVRELAQYEIERQQNIEKINAAKKAIFDSKAR